MADFKDAEDLDRETDRLVGDRQAREAATERQRQDEERTNREATQRKKLDDSQWLVQSSAGDLEYLDGQLAFLRAKLRNWRERHPQFRSVTTTQIAFFVLLMAIPLAAWTIDTIMLSYVVREIARGAVESIKGISSSSTGWTVLISAVLITLSYLAFEIAVGAKRDDEESSEDARRHSARFAFMLWITLPLFIFIFSLISSGVFPADPAKAIGRSTVIAAVGRAAMLGLIALVVHGIILRFGSAIVKAYGYGQFKAVEQNIMRQIRVTHRRRHRESIDLEGNVRELHATVGDAGDGSEQKVGPFSARTSRVVNTEFDAEVIETPHRRDQEPTGNAPGSAGQDSSRNAADPEPSSRDPRAASQTHTRDSESEAEWPGSAYDMSDEDEVN